MKKEDFDSRHEQWKQTATPQEAAQLCTLKWMSPEDFINHKTEWAKTAGYFTARILVESGIMTTIDDFAGVSTWYQLGFDLDF